MRLPLLCILLLFLILPLPASGAAVKTAAKVATVTTTQYAVVQTYVAVTKTTAVTTTYTPGSVVIESFPAGAEIWQGGNDLHQVTPYTIPIYAGVSIPGPYQLILKYPGYQDYSTTVTPRIGQIQTISAQLVPLATTTTMVTTTVVTSVVSTTSPPTQTVPVTTSQAPSRVSTAATQMPTTVPPVSLPGTTAPAGAVPSATTHIPRRVPGFEAAAAGSALACILCLKRTG